MAHHETSHKEDASQVGNKDLRRKIQQMKLNTIYA